MLVPMAPSNTSTRSASACKVRRAWLRHRFRSSKQKNPATRSESAGRIRAGSAVRAPVHPDSLAFFTRRKRSRKSPRHAVIAYRRNLASAPDRARGGGRKGTVGMATPGRPLSQAGGAAARNAGSPQLARGRRVAGAGVEPGGVPAFLGDAHPHPRKGSVPQRGVGVQPRLHVRVRHRVCGRRAHLRRDGEPLPVERAIRHVGRR